MSILGSNRPFTRIHGDGAVSFRNCGGVFPEADDKISTSPEIFPVNFPMHILIGKLNGGSGEVSARYTEYHEL
jgi:hypothetical protein